jgi:hypothetical protein
MIMMGCKGLKLARLHPPIRKMLFFPSLLMLEQAQKLYRGAKKM